MIPFKELKKEKRCGEGPDLERKAMAAANAVPLLVRAAYSLTGDDVGAIVEEIGHKDVEFRILAGVAVPLHFARQVRFMSSDVNNNFYSISSAIITSADHQTMISN